jgi:mannose-1-phosphate guanylyltransferase/mannose-1-phosphate guanylyltransferase/mannose-6-phosphate isomerase
MQRADLIVPVILCGGSGTRLWPRSRAAKPKPFLPLVGERTLFEATLDRCAGGEDFAAPLVVTGGRHLTHVEAQLVDAAAQVIVEPEARNTAAAIALAALRLPREAVMLVCPSDHHIGDCAAFTVAALAAAALAREGYLVAFGIRAAYPETGFGYIKQGEPLGDAGFAVERFVEKPERARAEAFIAEGSYHWNGGIFAFTAGDFLSELERYRPAIAEAAAKAVAQGTSDARRFHPEPAAFAAIDSESVDYAVMENTRRAAMVPVDMAWSDIGNWQALHAAVDRDAEGNAVQGDAELVDCANVFVSSDGPRVSVIGARDLVIVVDGGEILVTTTAGAQQVGKLGGALNQ